MFEFYGFGYLCRRLLLTTFDEIYLRLLCAQILCMSLATFRVDAYNHVIEKHLSAIDCSRLWFKQAWSAKLIY